MGQITSGVGLISGINTADLIDQLLSLEERPKQLVEQHNAVLTSQQVAFQDINAKLLALKLSAAGFTDQRVFQTTSATTSDESVLAVSSSASSVPGSFDFVVDRLVTTQQVVTGGFADRDATAIAPSGGTLTFEFGDAKLTTDTALSNLNGGSGVNRGKIRITDRSGASTVVDLSKALTVNDVLDAINNSSTINVTATVGGDGLQLSDNTGSAATSLTVSEVGTTGTAAGLGLLGTAPGTGDTIVGAQINRVGGHTALVQLNDGNGVRARRDDLPDFQVTQEDGTTFDVNLETAATVQDVIDAINTASGGAVTAAINDAGTGIKLTDSSAGPGTLEVTALNSSNAAADLGILGSDGDGDGTIQGQRVLASINSRLLKSLNGGSGVGLGVVRILDRDGGQANVDLTTAQSVDDVIALINGSAAGVEAAINDVGNGLTLTDTTGSIDRNLTVIDKSGSAAADLRLAGSVSASAVNSGNLQLRYISEATRLSSLNGGQGISAGRFVIRDSSGASATVDLSQGESTIQDVLTDINSRGLRIRARINDHGDGILIEDNGPGAVALRIEEAGSTTARDLGILGEAAEPGEDLDGSFETKINIGSVLSLQGNTTLAALNGGDGVRKVSGQSDLRITTRDGVEYAINLDGTVTVDNVINTIETATGGAVSISINAINGTLIVDDNTSGDATFTIEGFNDSNAAEDLGLAGSDDDDDGRISGTPIIEIFTLDNLVDEINGAGINLSATIINDGSSVRPYRLSLLSSVPGRGGAFLFDDGGLGLGASTLVEAEDAVTFFGSADPAKAVAITSPTNTLDSVIPGTSIDLLSTSSDPVRVTITRDNTAIVDAVGGFVERFNDVTSTLDSLDSFDAETEQRGLLLGDATVSRVRSSLFRLINTRNADLSGQFSTFAQIGITVGSGSRLQFDESKFANALSADPESVEQLFTFKETERDDVTGEVKTVAAGIGVRIDELLERLTNGNGGTIQSRVDSINRQLELNNQRIGQLDALLEARRARLEAEFLAMERALAQMQNQSSALGSLAPLVAQASNSLGAQ